MVEKEDNKEDLLIFKNKKINVSYNTVQREVSRDSGIAYNITDNFLVLELDDKKLKWIPLRRIIRIEEIN